MRDVQNMAMRSAAIVNARRHVLCKEFSVTMSATWADQP